MLIYKFSLILLKRWDRKGVAGGTPVLTNKSGTVVIIDDYYTSTGRDPNLEHLLKHLINTGRHSGIHIIYCAHLATRLPNEIKTNNNGIYISGSFMNNESVFKGLGYPMPEKENIIGYTDSIENEKKAWYLLDPMVTDKDGNIILTRIIFEEPLNGMKAIRSTLAAKIPYQDRVDAGVVKKRGPKKVIGIINPVPGVIEGNIIPNSELPKYSSEKDKYLKGFKKVYSENSSSIISNTAGTVNKNLVRSNNIDKLKQQKVLPKNNIVVNKTSAKHSGWSDWFSNIPE